MAVAERQRRGALWLERHAIPVGEVRVALPDGRVLCLIGDGREHRAGALHWRGIGGLEPDVVPVWWTLAQRSATVLDVGANVGVLALIAALANPDATVWAFEPLPHTIEVLRRNLAANPEADVHLVAGAAGPVTGPVELHWDAAFPTDGRATVLAAHPSGRPSPTLTVVEQVAIDSWADDVGIDHVDLVKIDVEGAEAGVLAGIAGVLERDRPHLIVELLSQDQAEAVGHLLAPFRYRHHMLTPSGPIQTDMVAHHVGNPNHLFTTVDDADLRTLWH